MSEFTATDAQRETGYRPPVEAPPEPPIIYVVDTPITPEDDAVDDKTREAADEHEITATEEDDPKARVESVTREVPEITPEADDEEPAQPKPQPQEADEGKKTAGDKPADSTDQSQVKPTDDVKPQPEPQPEAESEPEAQPEAESQPQPRFEPQPEAEAQEKQEVPQRVYVYASEPPPPRRGRVFASQFFTGDRSNPLFRADHPDNERSLGEVSANAGRVSREEVERIRSAAEQAGDYRPPQPKEPEEPKEPEAVPEPEVKPVAEVKEKAPEAKPAWASEPTQELQTVPTDTTAAGKPDPEKLLGGVFGDKPDALTGEVVDAELGEVINGKWVPADKQLPQDARPWERWVDPRSPARADASGEIPGAGRTRGPADASVEHIAMDGLGEAARAAASQAAAAAVSETPVTTQWQGTAGQAAQESGAATTAGYEAPTATDSVTGGERDEGASAATAAAGPAAASGSNSPGTGTATGRASVNPNAARSPSGQNAQPSAAAAPAPGAAPRQTPPDMTKPADTPPPVKKRDPIVRTPVPREVVRSRPAKIARATARLAAKAALGVAGAAATPIEATRKITVGHPVKVDGKRGTYSVRIIRNGKPAMVEVKPRLSPMKLLRMNTAQREAARMAAARQMVSRRRIRNTWRTM